MILEVMAGVAIGALLLPRRRTDRVVYIDREPVAVMPTYHPVILPYLPSLEELKSVKHGHVFCKMTCKCECGMDVAVFMMEHWNSRDVCPERTGDRHVV